MLALFGKITLFGRNRLAKLVPLQRVFGNLSLSQTTRFLLLLGSFGLLGTSLRAFGALLVVRLTLTLLAVSLGSFVLLTLIPPIVELCQRILGFRPRLL